MAEISATQESDGQPSCLIVDDDAGVCRAVSFTLKRLGIETSDVGELDALPAALAAREPDLIIVDLGLGGDSAAGATTVLPQLAERNYRGLVQLMSGRSQSVLDEAVSAGERLGLRMLPAQTKPFRMGVVKDLAARIVPNVRTSI